MDPALSRDRHPSAGSAGLVGGFHDGNAGGRLPGRDEGLAGGAAFLMILPGEMWAFRFGTGVTAPFAIADTAPVYLEYVLWED